MSNLPKSVVVGGVRISIVVDPDMENWGEYRSDDKKIALATKTLTKKQTIRETLRHEILHASLDIAGLSYLTAYQEEAIARCIDNIFHPAWDKVRKQLTHHNEQ
jgi:hypothetical protein